MFSKFELESGLIDKNFANLTVIPSTFWMDYHTVKDALDHNMVGEVVIEEGPRSSVVKFHSTIQPFASINGPVWRWINSQDIPDCEKSAITGAEIISFNLNGDKVKTKQLFRENPVDFSNREVSYDLVYVIID